MMGEERGVTAPGGRLIRWVARLVPARERAGWTAEWLAELEHAARERRGRGAGSWRVRLALTARAVTSISDALWLRRRHGGMGMLGSDVQQGTRVLRRHPGFAAAVVLTLALGIGAVTAIFSALDGLLLRPLPFREPERLAGVHIMRPYASPIVDAEAAAVWRTQGVFEAVRAHSGRTVTLTGRGDPRSLRAELMEPGLLGVLGVVPMLGRGFLPEESTPGRDRVVLLSVDLWQSAFAGDPGVVGETVLLDDEPHTVVGILPPSVRVLPGGMIYLALPLPSTRLESASKQPVYLLARLRADLTMAAAQARLDQVTERLEAERPRPQGWGVHLEPMRNWIGDGVKDALFVLGGAVAFLLLIACSNAAGLLFVHGTARQHEFAIRGALGGSRGALIRQLLVESSVLAALAGAAGVALAYAAVRLMLGILPSSLVRFTYTPIEVNGRVLLFALVATTVTSVLFSVIPAFRVSRISPALAGAGRGSTAGPGQRRIRSGLIVVELALAVILLTGAALLSRSFMQLTGIAPGYNVRDLVVAGVSLPASRYATPASRLEFRTRLGDALRGLPGVEGVSFTSGGVPPNTSFSFGLALETRDGGPLATQPAYLPHANVDTAYFSVMGVPIVAGRAFRGENMSGDAGTVIIDRDLAGLLWPGQSALGREFRLDADGPWLTVLGVAEDVMVAGPQERLGKYALYYPRGGSTVVMRTAAPSSTMLDAVRRAIWVLDPAIPLEVRSAETQYAEALQQPRFLLTLMIAFAALALLLAAVGFYGVVAYDVTRRSREIGVRVALGARTARVVRDIFAAGMALTFAGLVLGLAGALVLARFLRSVLFGVTATDPTAIAIVISALTVTCALALVLPSLRAARIDPLDALRAE